jgi:signal transduction histidine kinase
MRVQLGWAESSRRLAPYLDPAIAIVAVALALTSLLTTDPNSVDPRLEDPDVIAVVATALAAGALAWRRRRPVASYAVFVVGALVVSATFHYIGLLSVLMLLSLYSLATHGRRRDALIGLGVGAAAFVGLGLAGTPDLKTKDVLLAIALLVAAWAFGDAVRSRREQHRNQLETAVTQERLRIARELHDVVAHSMSLIAVQAGVGAHLIRTDRDAAEHSLQVIADTSRKALQQTRSMLGLLRETNEEDDRSPTQGLDDIPDLVDDVRRSGLDVTLVRDGSSGDVSPATSLAAYRIVQECLTNVMKHSTAATAKIVVTATRAGLDLEVTDPGPTRPRSGTSTGHGLLGLNERVCLVGGFLEAGANGAGFRVHAVLPTGAAQ